MTQKFAIKNISAQAAVCYLQEQTQKVVAQPCVGLKAKTTKAIVMLAGERDEI